MKSFGLKLKELREENGITQNQLIELIEKKYSRKIGKSMISKWENDKSEPERFSDVAAIADYFGVSVDYLTGISENKYGKKDESTVKKIKIFESINPNTPISLQDGEVGIEFTNSIDQIDFCLKVKEDSMIGARIFNNDVAYIRQQEDVESGEIAALIIGEQVYLRRVYKDYGKITLHSENPTIPDMIIATKDKKQIKILGKVVYVKFEVR